MMGCEVYIYDGKLLIKYLSEEFLNIVCFNCYDKYFNDIQQYMLSKVI